MFDLQEFAQRMPKAELHVHLEGSIRPATLLELAERNHIQLPAKGEIGLMEFYRFRDFPHFVQVYSAVTSCLRKPEDYQLVTYEFGASCVQQNIRYAEVTFSIGTNQRMTGLRWQEILEGLNAGRMDTRRDFGVELRWVFDIVRDQPETQKEVLEIALAARDYGCMALGLGGSEAGFPPELFVGTFNNALQAGLPRLPHAGETLGPSSIWTAINRLHATRLGHGVRCIEEDGLVRELARRQIPLEICPTSNIRLGIFESMPAHPLRRLWDAGLAITVGSDDPPMFNTSLNEEYQALVDQFCFTADELEQISLNGVRFSLLPEIEKQKLTRDFSSEVARLRGILS